MHATITRFKVAPGKAGETIAFVKTLVPTFKENIDGAKYYFYFAAGDDVVSLAIYESEADMHAAQSTVRAEFGQAGEAGLLAGPPEKQEVYEVAIAEAF